jgi:hypothetical protein
MTRSRSPRLPDAAQALSRNLHWFALAGGVTVTVLCAGFLLNVPLGVSLAVDSASPKDVFTSGLRDKNGSAEVLAGISGETFVPGMKMTASEDIVISNDEHQLAKVMLEDGADRCLTVTAANGQTLSFRIVGARPLTEGEKADAGKVELAIAACARNGQSVVKAVIEPEAGQQPRPANPEHSL